MTIKISSIGFPSGYSLDKTGMTQSLAHCFRQCPLKCLLKINRWHSKKGQEKSAIGNINHYVLSKVYGGSKLPIQRLITSAVLTEKDRYRYIDINQMDIYKTICHCLLEKYIKYYKDDFTKAKFTNTEREFAVLMHGILWRGKIDGEHTLKKEGSLYVLERKNKSRISDETIGKALSMDFQSRLYCKAKEVESGKPVAGFVYDIIRTPQMKPHKNETLLSFRNRLLKDIDDRPEYYFMRWETPLCAYDKKEFDTDLLNLSNDIKSSSWKRNTFSCVDGAFSCEYLDACIQGHLAGYYVSDRIFVELDCGV